MAQPTMWGQFLAPAEGFGLQAKRFTGPGSLVLLKFSKTSVAKIFLKAVLIFLISKFLSLLKLHPGES